MKLTADQHENEGRWWFNVTFSTCVCDYLSTTIDSPVSELMTAIFFILSPVKKCSPFATI